MKYYSVNWNYYHQFSGHQLLYGIIILRVGWVCLYTAEERMMQTIGLYKDHPRAK